MFRVCAVCGKAYGPEYRDAFCVCGFELAAASGFHSTAKPQPLPRAVAKPAPGTRCLVLYGPDGLPLHYFPISKDVTTIGRQDPVEGAFPEIDLGPWLDARSLNRISRKHALILHSRADDSFALRAVAGNTGTQLEKNMLPAQQDFPLRMGDHMILGGVARFKFECT